MRCYNDWLLRLLGNSFGRLVCCFVWIYENYRWMKRNNETDRIFLEINLMYFYFAKFCACMCESVSKNHLKNICLYLTYFEANEILLHF